MEGTLFVVIFFGGGMLWLLSKTAIGHALAERIRGAGAAAHPALLEELDRLRHDLAELQERMDFAERLLAHQREIGRIEKGSAP